MQLKFSSRRERSRARWTGRLSASKASGLSSAALPPTARVRYNAADGPRPRERVRESVSAAREDRAAAGGGRAATRRGPPAFRRGHSALPILQSETGRDREEDRVDSCRRKGPTDDRAIRAGSRRRAGRRRGRRGTVTFSDYLQSRRKLIDRVIEEGLTPAVQPPTVSHDAMRYAVLGGGKRLRPILAIAAAEACGAEPQPLLQHFAALELIHTYSLVHDDLPALDNDDLRRGRETTHVVFAEAMGSLTDDRLLTEAFSWLSRPIPGAHAPPHFLPLTQAAPPLAPPP